MTTMQEQNVDSKTIERKAKDAGRKAGRRDGARGNEFAPKQDNDAYVAAYTRAYEQGKDARIERQVAEAIEVEKRMDAELAANDAALIQQANDPAIAEFVAHDNEVEADESTVEYPGGLTLDTVRQMAGNALISGTISNADYALVCGGRMTLDLAKKRVHFGIAQPAVFELTKQAGQKKSKKAAKNKTPRSVYDYTVELLNDQGEVESLLHEKLTRKALMLDTGEKRGSKARRVLANRHRKAVRFTNNNTGKTTVTKPSK